MEKGLRKVTLEMRTNAGRSPLLSARPSTPGAKSVPADVASQTKEELLESSKAKVKDAESAARWLLERGFVGAERPSLEGLVIGLLRLSSGASAFTKEAMATAAVCLGYYAEDIVAGAFEVMAADAVASVKEQIEETTERAVKVMDDTRGALETMEAAAERRVDELKTVCALLDEKMEKLEEVLGAGGGGGHPHASAIPLSFAAALNDPAAPPPLSLEQERERGRAALQARQTLLDGVCLVDSDGGRIPPRVLRAKIEAAIGIVKDSGELDMPGQLTVAAVNVLKNGGVIVEWGTKENAEWIRSERNAEVFAAALGAGVVVKARTFKVVAKFVPVECDPERELREVERTNSLPEGSIAAARWIKPVQKRHPNQQVAHMQLTFKTPQEANRAITNRLMVGGKRVFVRRDLPEPFRCARCLQFHPWHLAKDCQAKDEVCRTCCSNRHRTKDCKVKNRASYRCAVCETQGHATWDRECPAYKEELARLIDRNPDLKNPLFPTDGMAREPAPSPWVGRAPSPTVGAGPNASQWSIYDAVGGDAGWQTAASAGPRPSQRQRKLDFRRRQEGDEASRPPSRASLTPDVSYA